MELTMGCSLKYEMPLKQTLKTDAFDKALTHYLFGWQITG